jgi:hypothetical protein
MLGFPPSLLTYWRNIMPVQMIELEEVTMVQVSDEELEGSSLSQASTVSGCTNAGSSWCDCTF